MGAIYDEVLYPSFPFPESHPDRLATQAILFGLTPPPVENCRVLELGCAAGGNLIPMAFGLPEGRFTGIDLAGKAIAIARTNAAALGLKNITLEQMDIRAAGRELGQFDYIVAHGIYSWVPPDVSDRLLQICSENLAPNGVAYVSYNTYPGGHFREMLRRMMLYHTRSVINPLERVQHGLALLSALADSMKESDPRRHMILRDLARMKKMRPASLVHDDFAEFNAPVYFYEFMERAARHGLAFLAEAEPTPINAGKIEGSRIPLEPDGVIQREQLFDFRVLREFRRTLLCHKEQQPRAEMQPECVRTLFVSSAALPDSPKPDVPSSQTETFTMADREIKVSTNHPPSKAALCFLSKQWPSRIPFDNLKAVVAAQTDGAQADCAQSLEVLLLNMYVGKLIELHAYAPRVAGEPSERPRLSTLARMQLRDQETATNLHHRTIQFDGLTRQLALLMDGTRDRAAVLAELESQVRAGTVAIEENGSPVQDRERAVEILTKGMDANLRRLARLSLLVE